MKIVRTHVIVVIPALISFASVTCLCFGQEWIHKIKWSRRTSQLVESYRRSVATGEVVRPVTKSDAIQCSSHCFWSLPTAVLVKTAGGDEFIYIARQASGSSAWRFMQVEPPLSNSITNEPGI